MATNKTAAARVGLVTASDLPLRFPKISLDDQTPDDPLLATQEKVDAWWSNTRRVLSDKLGDLNSEITVISARGIATLEKKVTTIANNQKTLVDEVTTFRATFDQSMAQVQETFSALATATSATAQHIIDIQAQIQNLDVGLLESRITTIEQAYVNESGAGAIARQQIEASITTLTGNTIGAAINHLSAVYVTQTSATSQISTAQSAAITTAQGYTDGQITSLSSVYATQTSVTSQISTAQSAAVSSANSYTSGQISSLSGIYATQTSVTSQISTAQSAAVTTAQGYTDGQISSLSSIYVTPTQVETARSSAISASASYTDGQVSTKAKITAATSAPSSPASGDLWIDTDDGRKTYVWTGSAWELANDIYSGNISTLSGRIDTVESSKVDLTDFSVLTGRTDTIESAINTPTTGILARISSIESTYVTATEATSIVTTEISSSISTGDIGDAISASVSTISSTLARINGDVEARYGMNVIAGGIATGFEIISKSGTTPTSVMRFRGDMESEDYSTSTAGWQLKGDGSVNLKNGLITVYDTSSVLRVRLGVWT